MGAYDVAEICRNGHVINDSLKSYPDLNKPFCDKCGALTISSCQHCTTEIPGQYYLDELEEMDVLYQTRHFSIPAFCQNCGKPYPWTEKKLNAAKDLASELDGLNGEEKDILSESLNDIIKDTPRTQVAVTRFKKLVNKSTGPAVQAMRSLIVDIASETAVKMLKEL